jgi:hypothetical protein
MGNCGVGSSSLGRDKNVHFSTSSGPDLGPTQPPIQWEPGVLFLEVKRPGREANHSLPTNAEGQQDVGLCTPPIHLHYAVIS